MNSNKQFTASSEEALPSIAQEIVEFIGKSTVVLFYGVMGVGKTTLIRSLCQALGVEELISSPTFSLVNEYQTQAGETVFHFDFYRIETPEEALDMGVEEYFYSGNYCLVEWPEKINEYLPENAIQIKITEENGIRAISVAK